MLQNSSQQIWRVLAARGVLEMGWHQEMRNEGSVGSFAGKTWEFGQLQSKAPLGFAFKATAIHGSETGSSVPRTTKVGGPQPGQCSATCCRSLKLL